ncbi:MAG: transketolase [Rickettsiaceae bacterium]|jgi:transketolase|nr:transketolase [Rickettsiaceae bacterium]
MQSKQIKEKSLSKAELSEMANAIRFLSMDAVQKANSGHPGMPMGMADVATVLFSEFLKFESQNPDWPDRDRFILSAGHGSMLLYSLLYLTGYKDITINEIKNFRQWGAKTAGHPEYGHAAGIETTTGPLGQGIANSVGFALGEQLLAAKFGKDIVDHYTYVIAGDGCLMEGISHEAISLAGHLKLNKLIVLFDDNGITIDGSTDLTVSDDQLARFKASGWDVQSIDGHDYDAIRESLAKAKTTDTPSLIACKTTIAYGAPTKAGKSSSHGSPLGDEEIKGTRSFFGWEHVPFEVPSEVLNKWREVGNLSNAEFTAWNERLNNLEAVDKQEFNRLQSGKLPEGLDKLICDLKKKYAESKPDWATRKSSGEVLKDLTGLIPELLGGSADLTGSNLTKTDLLRPIQAGDFSGGYVYYGVREHAMAAAMNGLALHKGFIPFGGTFLVFTDYCRGAMRLSALMQQRVVYVMTHDSIGLGEDGPTHQPVEHLAALRAIPNMNVFRPCDAVETAECWQLALEAESTPSVLALTRQNVPLLRTNYTEENLSAKGAYILSESDGDLQVTIFATGSEVSIAIDAQQQLQSQGIGTRVVSVPCMELFEQQEQEYRVSFFCNSSVKVVIEAAGRMGWDKFTGPHGIFIGMESFGASAPIEKLYEEFGITAGNVVNKVKAKLESKNS